MIRLDTNILVRYYVQDVAGADTLKQREAARRLMESGKPLMVCKTVLLELEWVMRGYYEFSTAEIARVMHHLLALPQVTELLAGSRLILPDRVRAVAKLWQTFATN